MFDGNMKPFERLKSVPDSKQLAQLRLDFPEITFCSKKEDRTRQEDRLKTRTDFLVRQFSLKAPPVQGVSGVQDFTVQYQDHVNARAEVVRAFQSLPEDVRSKYKDMDAVFAAVVNGELKFEEIPVEEPVPEAEPAGDAVPVP